MSVEFTKPLEEFTEADINLVVDDKDGRPRRFCHLLLLDAFERQVFLAFYAKGGGNIIMQNTGRTEIRFRQRRGAIADDYELIATPLVSTLPTVPEVAEGEDEDETQRGLEGFVVYSIMPLSYQFELRYCGDALEAFVVPRRARAARTAGNDQTTGGK